MDPEGPFLPGVWGVPQMDRQPESLRRHGRRRIGVNRRLEQMEYVFMLQAWHIRVMVSMGQGSLI